MKNQEYKGIFYGENTKHKYYEAGAHFSYFALVKALNDLKLSYTKMNSKLERQSQKNESLIKKETINVKKLKIPLLEKQRNNSMTNINKQNNNFFEKFQPQVDENTYSRNKYNNEVVSNNNTYNQTIKMPVISKNQNLKRVNMSKHNTIYFDRKLVEYIQKNQNNLNSTINIRNASTGNIKNLGIANNINHFLIDNDKSKQNKLTKNKNASSSCVIGPTANKYSNYCNNITQKKKKIYKIKSVGKKYENNSNENIIGNDNYKNGINMNMNIFNFGNNNKFNNTFLFIQNNYNEHNRSNSKVSQNNFINKIDKNERINDGNQINAKFYYDKPLKK